MGHIVGIKGHHLGGVNASAICNATYQCADYNLVSCPLGGSGSVAGGLSTCECATTKYWVCLLSISFNHY